MNVINRDEAHQKMMTGFANSNEKELDVIFNKITNAATNGEGDITITNSDIELNGTNCPQIKKYLVELGYDVKYFTDGEKRLTISWN